MKRSLWTFLRSSLARRRSLLLSTLTVISDVEGDETFSVNLTAAENAVILDGQGVGTLLNDDGAPAGSLQFSTSEYSISGAPERRR